MTRRVKWWGWGDPDREAKLAGPLRAFLFGKLRLENPDARRPSRPPDLPPPNPEVARTTGGLSEDAVRLAHAGGRSYVDLLRLRSPSLPAAPDAVAFPEDADQVRQLLEAARKHRWAVVPFGGGTSVLGGVAPLAEGRPGVLSISLTRMNHVRSIDPVSHTARIEAGAFGPDIEAALSRDGFELGHYPQSFEYSTLGGWIATRSAGQNSTGYGRIENMVVALRAVSPAGEIVTREVPASATGPELREVLVGSEGTLGIITDAVVRIHRRPERMHYRSSLFRSFREGVEAMRRIAQEGPNPTVARLSDEPETELSLKHAGADSKWGFRLLKLFGKGEYLVGGAHLLLGYEREADARAAAGVMRRFGGLGIGGSPGRHWERTRFDLPYLRDALMDFGVLVETLETAVPWSRLDALYRAVRASLEGVLPSPVVLTHISHLYPDGASLYFTFMCPARGREEELWKAGKDAASRAILETGGTISHHHGVGADHRPWLEGERGRVQMDMLRSLKRTLDPDGILNPGKLIPEAPGGTSRLKPQVPN